MVEATDHGSPAQRNTATVIIKQSFFYLKERYNGNAYRYLYGLWESVKYSLVLRISWLAIY